MHDEQLPPPRRRRAIYTAALATGLALGGFGIASAQTDTPATTTPTAPSTGDDDRPHLRFGTKGGPRGLGLMGGRGALHGEFVVPDGDGYRTAVVQRGTVTAVSDSAVTVESEDGFSATYVVDDNTLVNAGDDGIGDVAEGDEVHVRGFVVDGSEDPHASHVVDATSVGDIRRHWHPPAGA